MTRAYRIAATEVLALLSHTEDEAVKKIPRSFLSFLEEKSLKNYKPSFDVFQPINKLNLSSKAQALLGIIFLKYWATEDEKKLFHQRSRKKELENQAELCKNYTYDDIFKKVKK